MPSSPEDNSLRWEVVFTTNLLYKAEILRGLLDEEGIQAVIVNKQDSSYIAFGEIELLVPFEDVLYAKQIMERAATDE
jgi:hypothetical protein